MTINAYQFYLGIIIDILLTAAMAVKEEKFLRYPHKFDIDLT